MSEPEIATKAPESDVSKGEVPATATPGDTPAQTGPTMGEHCVEGRPTPVGQSSTGEIRKLGDVDVYVSKPAEYPHAPSKFLLLLTNGTGLHSVNNQIQADRFAREGFVVVMPDLFHGDPAPNSRTAASPAKAGELASPSLLDTFKIKAAETAKSFLIDMWLARHTEEKVMPILHKVLDASKEEFADAVANGGGVYAVGYCFGGRYVLLLGSEKPAPEAARASPPVAAETEEATPAMQSAEPARQRTASGPLIKAGAVAHPTLVSRDDFQHLKAPTTLACVEDDPMFPDEMRKAVEDHLQKTNVQHEVQVYPGVPHGFAVVGEYEDEKIISAQLTAHEQMLKWLKEH